MTETPNTVRANDGAAFTAISVSKIQTLSELNKRNREFWSEQSELTKKRASDKAILHVAMRDLQSESLRLPFYFQKTFDKALETAAEVKAHFQMAFSRKGRAARKTDPLHKLIDKIVRKSPYISERRLLHKLQNDETGVLVSVDRESDNRDNMARMIHYLDGDGKEKTAPLSGLKDRLSRAKKKKKK